MKRIYKNLSRGFLVRYLFFVTAFCVGVLFLDSVIFYTPHCTGTSGTEGTHKSYNHITNQIRELEVMDRQLLSQFNILFQKTIDGFDERKNSLIYSCDKACQDKGEYTFGLVSTFLLSILTDRNFGINSKECTFLSLYELNNKNWNFFPTSVQKVQNMSTILSWQAHYQEEYFLFRKDMETTDFNQKYNSELMVIDKNYNWIDDTKRKKEAFTKFPWVHTMTQSDIIRLVSVGMFSLPKQIKANIHEQIVNQTKNNRLVCFYGHENFDKAQKVFDFIKSNFKYKSKIFLKPEHLKSSNDNSIKDKFKSKIVSVDTAKMSENENCKRNVGQMIDLHVLRMCHVLITTNNEVGMIAAIQRRDSNGLYCVNDAGIIYKCNRALVTDSFRDERSTPVVVSEAYIAARHSIIKAIYT